MSRHIHYLRHGIEENCIKFIELMAIEGFPVLVTETTRTDAEQYQHYLNGASQAKTPSFHAEHAGLAFDICKNAKGQEYSDERFWEAAGRVGKAMGFTWGGDWTSFIDKPHFQWDAHGKYTSAMIRNKQYPPTMPLFTGVIPPVKPTVKTQILKKGSRGTDVAELQTRLNYLGYPCGISDGIWGAKTDTAVKAFQKAAKIGVDGIVGAQTWKALDSAKPTGLLLELPNMKRIEYVKGLEPTEKIDAAYNRIGCDIIINANFFGLSSGIPVGYLADEGKTLSDWLLSKWGFEFPDKKKAVFAHWDKRTGADFLGGYPCLLRDGKIAIDTTEIGFSASSTTRRARTAIGTKADGTFVIRCVKESEGLSITELAHCMIAIGCVNAVNLDGGGSTSWITKESKYITSKALDGFLAVWL